MIRALLVALLVAGPAAAQEKDKPAERPHLNLKLDNPSSFARTAPPEEKAEKGLPSLGANARKIEPSGPSRTLPGNGPVPRDANPNP